VRASIVRIHELKTYMKLLNRVNTAELPRYAVAYPAVLFGGGGGVTQTQLRTEERENGYLGVVVP